MKYIGIALMAGIVWTAEAQVSAGRLLDTAK
jgi:hypothetical protein